MHNIKRVKNSEEARQARLRREAVKIVEYRALVDKVLTLRKNGEYNNEALNATTTLLKQNPEYYSIWNYRREIFNDGLFKNTNDDESKQKLIDEELSFLFGRLREYPKCYWIWNHRKWCFEVSSKPNWVQELGLVTKMLEYDARNYHGWHYRRYVVEMMESETGKSMTKSEFDYTTSKINSNFSNFSAWHNRTKLIPRMIAEDPSLSSRELLKSEVALITQAIYTDPDDQSVWLYHRWLLTSPDIVPDFTKDEKETLIRNEIKSILQLYEVEPDSKWCLQSLVFYETYLSSLTNQTVDVSVKDYIEKLKAIDPMRTIRYNDLELSL
ncbi:hypothetical protein V1511DRAFT_491824 [Dipodascopsis uninucleata]